MADIERKWTLLVRPDLDDHIMRSRSGDVPLGPDRDDMERVVVVPEAQLAGAVDALERLFDLELVASAADENEGAAVREAKIVIDRARGR